MSKTALVTGASSGIGYEFAKILAENKYNLVIVSRSLDKLNEIKNNFEQQYQVSVLVFPADLSVPNICEEIYKELTEKKVVIDVLVNNAGYAERVSIEETNETAWDKMINVNLNGTYRMIRSFLPLLKQSKGTVLNIASLAGTSGYEKFPGFGAYSAAKAGVVALTEVLAVEHKEDGLNFYCISPGGVKTQMLASVLPDFEATMVPKDIADRAVELLLGNVEVVSGENVVVA